MLFVPGFSFFFWFFKILFLCVCAFFFFFFFFFFLFSRLLVGCFRRQVFFRACLAVRLRSGVFFSLAPCFLFSIFFFFGFFYERKKMSDEDDLIDILNDSPAASKRQKSSQDVPELLQQEQEKEEDEEEDQEDELPKRKVSARKSGSKSAVGPKRVGKQPSKAKKAKADDYEQEEEGSDNNDDDDADLMDEGDDDDESGGHAPRPGVRKFFSTKPNTSLKNEGIIERIHLVNFMVHANLDVVLGPNINFITGENGSGKSAILIGLSLGLGASTSFAQRSNKLGAFVRTGQQKAIISVTLRNVGEDTYKHELYGDYITVERTILLAGTSTFKFRDQNGKVVCTDRSELVPLCDRFNIQINNPCIIMMQETSRDFLGHSTPKKKYELFERATQIKVKKLGGWVVAF